MSQTGPSNASKALRLYRSLLRETTYLPDEAAQSYFHRWISHRFHSASKLDPEGLSNARNALNRLRRANHGDIKALAWVLDNTYGRIGKRRRELIDNLRASGDERLVPKDDAEVKRLLENRRTGKTLGLDQPRPIRAKLQALISSHKQTSTRPDSPRSPLKTDKPEIPDKNIWGRPTPLKLRAGMERRWFASTLDKLLPPLPSHDYERLYNLAMGITPFPGVPLRRASKTLPQTELISQKEIASYLQPIEHVEKLPIEERHKITARFMRRLWMRVLRLCPVMTQNETTKRWDVQWFTIGKLPITSIVTTASLRDLELFEGSSAETTTTLPKGRLRNRLRNSGLT